MKAFNRKRKMKHTTKGKWKEILFWDEFLVKNTKSKSETDELLGNVKFKAYGKYKWGG